MAILRNAMLTCAAFAVFTAVPAFAESVLWNTSYNGTLYGSALTINALNNPNVTVSYFAQMTNKDTGENIPCGATVPSGTRIGLEFVPHKYTDIYWFGTGGPFDSPYGDWIGDAAMPPVVNSCVDKNYIGENSDPPNAFYVSLSVDPPGKSITGIDSMGCAAGSGGSQNCTPDPGTYSPVFEFAPTTGKFWPFNRVLDEIPAGYVPHLSVRYQWFAEYKAQNSAACYGNPEGKPMETGTTYRPDPSGATYLTDAQSFVLDVPHQSISCPVTVAPPVGDPPEKPTLSSGACTVGAPQAITMTSTDPDGDTIRYGVDWDANGTVDQWVPTAGYVSSGTAQTASRTYAIPGNKTGKVRTQDSNGNSSAWATISFSCGGTAAVGLNEGSDGSGGAGDPLALLPDLDLRVIPSLVKSGATTKVNWGATNVQSCAVTGSNGDAWTGLLSSVGGEASRPITGEVTYTLSCLDLQGVTLTKQAKVTVIPVFQEK